MDCKLKSTLFCTPYVFPLNFDLNSKTVFLITEKEEILMYNLIRGSGQSSRKIICSNNSWKFKLQSLGDLDINQVAQVIHVCICMCIFACAYIVACGADRTSSLSFKQNLQSRLIVNWSSPCSPLTVITIAFSMPTNLRQVLVRLQIVWKVAPEVIQALVQSSTGQAAVVKIFRFMAYKVQSR